MASAGPLEPLPLRLRLRLRLPRQPGQLYIELREAGRAHQCRRAGVVDLRRSMSYVKLERRPLSWWRVRGNLIGQMIDQGWSVWSVFESCYLVKPADLEWLAYRLGEMETLRNRHPNCRHLRCQGVITFYGTPLETNQCMGLKAEWPKEWAIESPTVLPRPPEKKARPSPAAKAPEAALRSWMR